MATGAEFLKLARSRVGERYEFACVPKNNPNWHGPWDCAEFMSWLVYQVGGYLYGCVDDNGNPASVEAYTGAWQSDSRRLGIRVPAEEAAATPGAILLRYPPSPGSMGHIVVCDGRGGTVEAKGHAYGVCTDRLAGRVWDTGIFLPGFAYDQAAPMSIPAPTAIYRIGAPNMSRTKVMAIQSALAAAGFDPGPIDGEFGHNTAVAVAAFQTSKGLVVDGQVGPTTAKKLAIDLDVA